MKGDNFLLVNNLQQRPRHGGTKMSKKIVITPEMHNRIVELYEKKDSIKNIAADIGCSYSFVYSYIRNHPETFLRRYISPELRNQIIGLWNAGASPEEISEKLSISLEDLYKQYPSAKVVKKVFNWVKFQLDINYPDRPISNYSYMAESDNVKEVCRIISAFGTGITNFELVDVAPEKVLSKLPDVIRKDIASKIEEDVKKLKTGKKQRQTEIGFIMRSDKDFFIMKVDKDENVECKTIQFYHNNINSLFSLEEESDGTVRLLDLLEILLAGDDKTYVVDELDRCLHPSLTYKFVDTFLEEAAKKNIQLIVTTHESRLMDFDLLRRDEIWFVDKKKNGETDIYSLEEYNERFDKKIDKAYLEGRYGGVPIFSTVFPVKGE